MDSTRFSPWRESALLLIAKLAPGTDFIEYYARCLVKSRSGTGSSAPSRAPTDACARELARLTRAADRVAEVTDLERHVEV